MAANGGALPKLRLVYNIRGESTDLSLATFDRETETFRMKNGRSFSRRKHRPNAQCGGVNSNLPPQLVKNGTLPIFLPLPTG
jgi:hypothetical protein